MIKMNKTAIALGLTAALWSSTAMAIDLGGALGSVTETVNSVTETVTDTVKDVTGIESSVKTSSGGGSLLGVDASVSGVVDAKVNVGGSGGLLDVDLNIGGGGNGNHGGNGTNGTNGTNGRNGIFGNNGNNRNNGAIIRSGGSGSGGFVATATCSGTNPNQLVNLFESTRIRNWDRATSIQLVPVPVCSAVRKELAGWLATNQDFHRMVGAVASDALINAALSRTKYQPGNVIGVQSSGSTLTVYVF